MRYLILLILLGCTEAPAPHYQTTQPVSAWADAQVIYSPDGEVIVRHPTADAELIYTDEGDSIGVHAFSVTAPGGEPVDPFLEFGVVPEGWR